MVGYEKVSQKAVENVNAKYMALFAPKSEYKTTSAREENKPVRVKEAVSVLTTLFITLGANISEENIHELARSVIYEPKGMKTDKVHYDVPLKLPSGERIMKCDKMFFYFYNICVSNGISEGEAMFIAKMNRLGYTENFHNAYINAELRRVEDSEMDEETTSKLESAFLSCESGYDKSLKAEEAYIEENL